MVNKAHILKQSLATVARWSVVLLMVLLFVLQGHVCSCGPECAGPEIAEETCNCCPSEKPVDPESDCCGDCFEHDSNSLTAVVSAPVQLEAVLSEPSITSYKMEGSEYLFTFALVQKLCAHGPPSYLRFQSFLI